MNNTKEEKMIRLSEEKSDTSVLVNPDHIVGVAYDHINNWTRVILPNGDVIAVRETVSEVDLLIQQYRRANS